MVLANPTALLQPIGRLPTAQAQAYDFRRTTFRQTVEQSLQRLPVLPEQDLRLLVLRQPACVSGAERGSTVAAQTRN